jgi:hypothetical protein
MNPLTVLIKTFVDPVKAFAFLKEKPFIVLALALSLVMGSATAFFVTHYMDEAGMRAAIREQMEKRGGSMTDDQIEEFAAKQAKISRIAGPIAGLVMPAIIYLILALIFFLAFKLLDSDFSYKQSLSVTVHGFLPGILSSLIAIGLILKAGTVDPMAAENLVRSNLGFLADRESQKALFSFLSSIDLFSLWSLGLLTLGFGTLSGKGFKGALPVTVGLWAVYVAGKVGLSLVFSR